MQVLVMTKKSAPLQCPVPTSPLVPINQEDHQRIEEHITKLHDWYAALDMPDGLTCQFNGTPRDIEVLDYIFYEFGATPWYWDNGLTHALVWGNVAVRHMGFEWCKLGAEPPPQLFAVRSPEVPCIVFPWTRLYELVSTLGRMDNEHEYLWLSTITRIDELSLVPRGWHPVLDAIYHGNDEFPRDIVDLFKDWRQRDRSWLITLEMDPYDWHEETDWESIRSFVGLHLNTSDKL